MGFQVLFAMEYLDEVDTGFRVCHPGAGVPHHDGHGRKSYQTILVDEFQFVRVAWIEAQAKAQRIDNRVPFTIALNDILKRPVQNLLVI